MAIEQQQELYKLKKELTELQLLKVNEELKKATDDAELSSLKLQQFKEQVHYFIMFVYLLLIIN